MGSDKISMNRVMIVAATSLLIIATYGPARARAELQPCRDAFSAPASCYNDIVRRLFLPERSLWDSRAMLRMVVLPSCDPEWAIAVYQKGAEAQVDLKVVAAKLDYIRIESYDAEKGYCPSPTEIAQRSRVIERSSPISLDLARELGRFWQRTLMSLGSPEPTWSSDGTFYHASAWAPGHGSLCGETWSPDAGRALVMVKIAEVLRSLTDTTGDRSAVEGVLWRLVSADLESPEAAAESDKAVCSDG